LDSRSEVPEHLPQGCGSKSEKSETMIDQATIAVAENKARK
jgi:hypothetical protein